mgnify:CR=1 FL=1
MNLNSITCPTLKLVNRIGSLAISMGGDNIREVGVRVSEQIGRIMNSTDFAPRPITRKGYIVGRSWY